MSRGNIESRGRGTYRIRIYLGTGPDGKQKYHRETVKGTKRQAQIRLTELLREIDTGGYVERSNMSTGEYLEYWLNKAVKPYLRPKTVSTYRQAIARVSPHIGHIPLQQIRPLDLQEYYAWALKEGKGLDKDGQPQGLSQSTVSIDHRTLHKALEDAVTWGLLARNAAGSVATKPKPEHRTREVWTNEQSSQFLEATSGHRLFAYFVLALTAGLRRGELCGLRREDLNLDEFEIWIHQILVEIEDSDGKVELVIQDKPKTEESEGPVAISQAVADILRTHLARQAEERLQLGSRYEDHGLVFCQPNGKPYWPSHITSRIFPDLCKMAGVPVIRHHDTRHTFITRLLNDKVPPHIAQRRARHTSWSTTVGMYAHVTKATERASVDLTDDILPENKRLTKTQRIIDEEASGEQ